MLLSELVQRGDRMGNGRKNSCEDKGMHETKIWTKAERWRKRQMLKSAVQIKKPNNAGIGSKSENQGYYFFALKLC